MNGILAYSAILFFITAFSTAHSEVLYTIDFSGQPNGKADDWLRKVGFEYELDAKELDASFSDNRLLLETQDDIAGLFAYRLNLPDATSVRITWGVNRYPEGANWETGNYRVPIAAVISLGTEKVKSGVLFLPSAPYFISPFLSRNATDERIYTAKYYKKSGRYICNPCAPEPGKLVTTTIDLKNIFESEFKKDEIPPVSGFALQMNTKDTQGGASAFIQKVEFLSDQVNPVKP